MEEYIVYFNPDSVRGIGLHVNLIVNDALGRGRKNKKVSGEDVLALKRKYSKDGKMDLSEIRDNPPEEMDHYARSRHVLAIRELERYCNSIDESYEINGVISARPKLE